MRSRNFLLPAKGLPQTWYPPRSESEWIDLDSRESFGARGENSKYPAGSITYRFNSFGYRCPEEASTGIWASNDYISRTLFLAVPFLNPDIVLVNFTHLHRREYVTAENKMIPYHVQQF